MRRSLPAIACLIGVVSTANAQIDPAEMSGIPLPDPSLAPGTISVRVLGGDFDHPMVGQEVTLDGPGGVRSAKTDKTARATFGGLAVGDDRYVASAKSGDETVASQPIPLTPAAGVKLLLVFKAGAHGTTGRQAAGAPSPLSTADTEAITIAERSHFILEVKDEGVVVIENWFFQNVGSKVFKPGEGGLAIELPSEAFDVSLGPNAQAAATIEDRRIKFRGPLPPGGTPFSFAFSLPQHDHAVTLRQTLPFALAGQAYITDHYPGMVAEGAGLETTEKTMKGRTLWLITGPAVRQGGTIEVKLSNLPHVSTLGRNVAVGLAAAIVLWGIALSLRAPRRRTGVAA